MRWMQNREKEGKETEVKREAWWQKINGETKSVVRNGKNITHVFVSATKDTFEACLWKHLVFFPQSFPQIPISLAPSPSWFSPCISFVTSHTTFLPLALCDGASAACCPGIGDCRLQYIDTQTSVWSHQGALDSLSFFVKHSSRQTNSGHHTLSDWLPLHHSPAGRQRDTRGEKRNEWHWLALWSLWVSRLIGSKCSLTLRCPACD